MSTTRPPNPGGTCGTIPRRHRSPATCGTHFAGYLTELARSWHPPSRRDRALWLQEIGAPLLGFDGKPVISGARAPEFAERTVRAAVRSARLWGITWWCSHDVSRSPPDFPELEYSLGLIGQDGRPKPIAWRLSELIKEYDGTPPEPARRETAVLVSGKREDARIGKAVMNTFSALVDQGRTPAIVREEPASDDAYLAARGITEVVRPRRPEHVLHPADDQGPYVRGRPSAPTRPTPQPSRLSPLP